MTKEEQEKNAEAVVAIAKKMYKAREIAKEVLGKSYDHQLKLYKQVIEGTQLEFKLDILSALTLLLKKAMNDGNDAAPTMLMATASEMLEQLGIDAKKAISEKI